MSQYWDKKTGEFKGRPYGSQYHTVLQSGNIKFVEKNGSDSESLMETMTPSRIYVHVGGEDLKSIVYFDESNKRSKQIDLDHRHEGAIPHVHDGYYHDSFRKSLTAEERQMVDIVYNIWKSRR